MKAKRSQGLVGQQHYPAHTRSPPLQLETPENSLTPVNTASTHLKPAGHVTSTQNYNMSPLYAHKSHRHPLKNTVSKNNFL